MYLNIEKKSGLGCDYILGLYKCLQVLSMYKEKTLQYICSCKTIHGCDCIWMCFSKKSVS